MAAADALAVLLFRHLNVQRYCRRVDAKVAIYKYRIGRTCRS